MQGKKRRRTARVTLTNSPLRQAELRRIIRAAQAQGATVVVILPDKENGPCLESDLLPPVASGREFQLEDVEAGPHRERGWFTGEPPIARGEIALDPGRYQALKRGREIHLTPLEFELLYLLMARAGQTISYKRLLQSIWGPEFGREVEYLRTFIRQLRIKIEDDPAHPRHILTDSRIGYRFDEPADGAAVQDEARAG